MIIWITGGALAIYAISLLLIKMVYRQKERKVRIGHWQLAEEMEPVARNFRQAFLSCVIGLVILFSETIALLLVTAH